MGLREETAFTGDASSSSSSDVGPSGSDGIRRFPLAAQPEIMRAAEKDEQYASFVCDACRDAFRHLFGTRVAVAYQSETKLLGQMLYYVLTTGAGKQTLGEEYCDITQVSGPYGLAPTPARRSLFIFYQTAFPYIAERISSRIASQSITMADSLSDDIIDNETTLDSQIQPSTSAEMTSSLSSGVRVSVFSRFSARFTALWSYAVRRWPSVYIIICQNELLGFVMSLLANQPINDLGTSVALNVKPLATGQTDYIFTLLPVSENHISDIFYLFSVILFLYVFPLKGAELV